MDLSESQHSHTLSMSERERQNRVFFSRAIVLFSNAIRSYFVHISGGVIPLQGSLKLLPNYIVPLKITFAIISKSILIVI